jgi:hypothetical protein
MRWLERALQEKAFMLRCVVPWDTPILKHVRSDPRFAGLKQRVLTTTFKD